MDCEDRLEVGEDLLECVNLLGIGSFLSGEGLMEGAGLLGGFLQSELLRAEGFLPSFLPGEERARGDVLLGGEGDDDLSQAEGDAHLWDIYLPW